MSATKKTAASGLRAGARSPALDSILNAAAHAFAEHGYHGMSMRDLARVTRRSPATLYNYVDSKEDLLYLIQRDAYESMTRASESALEGESEPMGRLRRLVHSHLRFFSEKPYLMRVLLHDSNELGRERHQEITALKHRYFELVREVVVRALETRGVGIENSMLDSYTHIFLAMLNARLTPFDGADNETNDELAQVIEKITVDAFALARREANREP